MADIKSDLTKLISQQMGWLTDEKTLEKSSSIIWQNNRNKSVGGLRLTDEGLRICCEVLELKKYDISFPRELTITNQTMIWLDRFIDSPYYINKKSIIVFKEKTAVQLILFSGDVQKFGLAKAISNQKNPENLG